VCGIRASTSTWGWVFAGALLAAGYQDVTLFDAEVEEEPVSACWNGNDSTSWGVHPTPLIYEAWEAAAMAKAQGRSPSWRAPPDADARRVDGAARGGPVVRGEAEETLVDIVREVEQRHGAVGDWAAVKGVSWRDARVR